MEAKRKLNNPYGLKLDSANLLILGMEGLRPGRVVPVSQAAVEDAGAVSDADDQQGIVTLIVLSRKGPHGFPFRRPHSRFPIH